MRAPDWKPGDRLRHRFNPELGPGLVVSVEGRRLAVAFPDTGQTLSLALTTDALEPLVLAPGSRARLAPDDEEVAVVEDLDGGNTRLADGRVVETAALWPVTEAPSPIERLARGEVDHLEDFRNRLDAVRLQRLREAEGLGSFLGGRIDLFPHQLYAAEQASTTDPVRWLLADEVGLGKTVEACLIMNRLIHTGRANRTLVMAPETLVVQWLGELWRKHHQVFVLLDEKRLRDVEKDYGVGFNPFEVHAQTIVSLERLAATPKLVAQARDAAIDLLVVDEAHHLRRPEGHPGEPAYRAVAALAKTGRNVLLLTGTPLEDDAHGFFRLLQLLRPDELPEDEPLAERLARNEPLPPCVSAARRADVGGLPPRQGCPVDLGPEADAGWAALEALVRHVRLRPAPNAAARRAKAGAIARALAGPAPIASSLSEDPDGRALCAAADAADPRIAWLVRESRRWRTSGDKVLIFVAHRASLDRLRRALEHEVALRVAVFHEDLSPERRDVEVAQFRLPEGAPVLISTECGGEGRNFTFCDRLVLFDLPWHPAVVEQRIGRLDRIGRGIPVEIVYFRPPSGLGRAISDLYEEIGLFREPLGGVSRELRRVARAVEAAVVDGDVEISAEMFRGALAEAEDAQARVREAAYHALFRDPYRGELGPKILSRVPPDLETLTADVVLRALARFGFEVEQQRADGVWLLAFGSAALVDHLPGVAPDARFLGTFDRGLAVVDESLDFFASGHPLVEGVLAELEDGGRGRAVGFGLELDGVVDDADGVCLLAVLGTGVSSRVVVVDRRGASRPEWVPRILQGLDRARRVDVRRWARQPGWRRALDRMAAGLPEANASDQRLQAAAIVRLRPRDESAARR